MPFLLNAFYKMITPFIDPVTKDKMRFNPRAVEDGLFTPDNLWVEFGGDVVFEYDHEIYWHDLLETTTKHREAMMARWRALGGTVGIREWDMKDGDGKEQASAPTPTPAPAVETIVREEAEEEEQEDVKGSSATVEVEPAPVSVAA